MDGDLKKVCVITPMPEEIDPPLPAPELGPCVCAQVRRLARKLSSFYDTLLAPENLTITQYSLLVNIERAGRVNHSVLAEKVGMERTTLTRNLRPLSRANWIAAVTGKDRRQQLLHLTAAGRRKLIRSLPLWEEAQRRFLSQIDAESMQKLRTLFALTDSAVTEALIAHQKQRPHLVYRLAYNGDVVAFKMGRRQGARRAHISIDT
jgi:DNA-binding MarR family transcriptional regulator